jgi:hypothetical protein
VSRTAEHLSAMMKSRGAVLAIVIVVITGAGSHAFGAEARPWLCRAKPVFSSDKPMTYEATNRGGGRWLMTFMRFDPSGLGHDGFTVSSAEDVSTHIQGNLEAGQWYALALYLSGGHWICPGNAAESDEPAAGVISDLCYGRDLGECTVKLTVRPLSAASGPSGR